MHQVSRTLSKDSTQLLLWSMSRLQNGAPVAVEGRATAARVPAQEEAGEQEEQRGQQQEGQEDGDEIGRACSHRGAVPQAQLRVEVHVVRLPIQRQLLAAALRLCKHSMSEFEHQFEPVQRKIACPDSGDGQRYVPSLTLLLTHNGNFVFGHRSVWDTAVIHLAGHRRAHQTVKAAALSRKFCKGTYTGGHPPQHCRGCRGLVRGCQGPLRAVWWLTADRLVLCVPGLQACTVGC